MSLTDLTKNYDAKKTELDRAREHVAALEREMDGLRREISRELELDVPFQLDGEKPAKKRQRAGGGTKRITKERVHAWLSEKPMTIGELAKVIENSGEGFKTENLEERLSPILAEVATSKGDKYSAKKSWTSSRGRGK